MEAFATKAKFIAGACARSQWRKPLQDELCTVSLFNAKCGNKFSPRAKIVLDDSERRQTTIKVEVLEKQEWKRKSEHIYLIVRDNAIVKIGGTRTGMKNRWGSYLCGHCVPQRIKKRDNKPFPGKMSVTNAHLYHTIEEDLLAGHVWEFWSWKLPKITVSVEILGEPIDVIAQTYHAYETRCIQMFKKMVGHIPQLCDNADPNYRNH